MKVAAILGLVGGSIAIWANPPKEDAAFLVLWIVGVGLLVWFTLTLKRVRVDERFIYISSRFHEEPVPLRLIEDVRENRWINLRPVTIYFRTYTVVGKRITFMPKMQLAFWRPHSIVDELKTMALSDAQQPLERSGRHRGPP